MIVFRSTCDINNFADFCSQVIMALFVNGALLLVILALEHHTAINAKWTLLIRLYTEVVNLLNSET